MNKLGLLPKIGLVLAASFLGLLVSLGVFQYANLKGAAAESFEKELGINTQLVALALARPAYEYNTSMIESLLDSFLVNESIASIEVRDDSGKILVRKAVEARASADNTVRERELTYQAKRSGASSWHSRPWSGVDSRPEWSGRQAP
jgi:hypothetical protein